MKVFNDSCPQFNIFLRNPSTFVESQRVRVCVCVFPEKFRGSWRMVEGVTSFVQYQLIIFS